MSLRIFKQANQSTHTTFKDALWARFNAAASWVMKGPDESTRDDDGPGAQYCVYGGMSWGAATDQEVAHL